MSAPTAHLSARALNRYLSNTLTPAELLWVDEHLYSCPACKEHLLESEAVFQAYDLFVDAEPEVVGYSAGSLAVAVAGSEARERPHPRDELLIAHVEGRIHGAARLALEDHLAACPRCAAEARELQELAAVLAAMDTAGAASA
jgi:anti-sigma factor RsiW